MSEQLSEKEKEKENKTSPNALVTLNVKIINLEHELTRQKASITLMKATIRIIWVLVSTVFKGVITNSVQDKDKVQALLTELDTAHKKVMEL